MLMFIFNYSFLCGLLCFCMSRKHLLFMLLSLEFVVLSLYYGLFLQFNYLFGEYFFCIFFLLMMVCEGCLGLSVLVSMIRFYGNDFIMSVTLLW